MEWAILYVVLDEPAAHLPNHIHIVVHLGNQQIRDFKMRARFVQRVMILAIQTTDITVRSGQRKAAHIKMEPVIRPLLNRIVCPIISTFFQKNE